MVGRGGFKGSVLSRSKELNALLVTVSERVARYYLEC